MTKVAQEEQTVRGLGTGSGGGAVSSQLLFTAHSSRTKLSAAASEITELVHGQPSQNC